MTDTSSTPPADLVELFASAEVPARLAHQVAAGLGPGAARELRDNPWRPLAVPGVRREQADFFARRLLGA
ncbi:conjugal transfer protein TraA, partial [Actinoallomurus acaciae]